MQDTAAPGDDAKVNQLPQLDELANAAQQAEHRETVSVAIRKHPRAIFWALIVALSVIMEGYDTILISNFYAYPSFVRKYGTYYPNVSGSITDKYQVSAAWQSGIGNASTVGGFVGGLLNGYLVDRFGKKRVMLSSLTVLVGFIFIVFFANDKVTLLLGEFLCGLPWGVFATLSPAYASEVMPLALRGYLTSYTQLWYVVLASLKCPKDAATASPSFSGADLRVSFALGQLIAAGVLAGMVHVPGPWSYHGPFAIQWFWPAILIPILLFAPESPWDLVRHSRIEDARRSVRKLHNGTTEELESILALIIHTDNQEIEMLNIKTSFKMCFVGVEARRTEIAVMTFIGQVLLGMLGSTSYFYEQVGLTTEQIYDLNLGSSGLSVLALLLFWLFLLPNFGRRTIYMGAGMGIFIILLIVGLLQVHASHTVGMAQSVLMLLFNFIFQGTIAPLGWAIPAEVGSTRLRQKTIVIARNGYYIASTVGSVLSNYMLNPTAWDMRGYETLVWAGTTFCFLVWAYFRLVETKDRSYEELNLLFAKKIPARRFKAYEVHVFDPEEGKGGVTCIENSEASTGRYAVSRSST